MKSRMIRFLDSFTSAKSVWIANISGLSVWSVAEFLPDAFYLEICLKNVVLVLTILSLSLSIAVRARAFFRGKKQ